MNEWNGSGAWFAEIWYSAGQRNEHVKFNRFLCTADRTFFHRCPCDLHPCFTHIPVFNFASENVQIDKSFAS